MGVVTGSDCNSKLILNKELMDLGLIGEGLVDQRIWVVKTHYPERWSSCKFKAQRAILLVRSPLDAFTSLFHMQCSGSHDVSVHEDEFVKHEKIWRNHLAREATVWADFHAFWLNSNMPLHIVRYEDIKLNPKETLTDLMRFMLKSVSLTGTKIESFIQLAT